MIKRRNTKSSVSITKAGLCSTFSNFFHPKAVPGWLLLLSDSKQSMAQLDGGKSPKAADRNDEDTARAALFLGFNFLSTVALININKYVFTKAHFGFPAALLRTLVKFGSTSRDIAQICFSRGEATRAVVE